MSGDAARVVRVRQTRRESRLLSDTLPAHQNWFAMLSGGGPGGVRCTQ